MFRLSKLSVTLILFFILAAVPVFAKTETNPGTSYCDCCVLPLVPWTGYGCTERNHSGDIHHHQTLNVSCYNITSGLYQSTSQILDTHCEYGCNNATGMCIDPSTSIQYLWIIEIAFLALLAIIIIIFITPLPPGFENLKLLTLIVMFVVVFLLFLIINIYSSNFTGGLLETMGGWVGSIMLFFWPIIYMLIGLFAMYTVWALFVKKPKDEEDEL